MIDVTAPADNIADAKLRRGFIVLRWLLLNAYMVLSSADVLPVAGAALYISSGVLAAYFLFLTVVEIAGKGDDPWLRAATRYCDVMGTTAVLIAMHDVSSPVWAVYFLTIVGIAHMVNRREMIGLVGWVSLNYAAAAVVNAQSGDDVTWGYVLVIELVMAVMGVNATLLAGGQQKIRDVLAHAASTDSLTGVPNRRSFHSAFISSLKQAISAKSALAFMLIDVDHFKEINDQHGHPAGDDKLREVATALTEHMRAGDLLARYGGDEFSVVAPNAARNDAVALAERLRLAAAGCGASISIGIALYPDDASTEDTLIEAADRALYQAKEAGRNCVRVAQAA